MTRLDLERQQVWIYLAAILAGLGLGLVLPGAAAHLEAALWPLLGILIFVTFTQVPLIHLPQAFRDRRFMGAMLAGNFVIVPLIVAGLLMVLPADPAVRLGVLLVLLVPCTDWYITFTHLSGGDTGRAIAATPVNLIVQMALLPAYLWLFMGSAFLEIFAVGPIATVFLTLIVVPLVAAWLLERWVEAGPVILGGPAAGGGRVRRFPPAGPNCRAGHCTRVSPAAAIRPRAGVQPRHAQFLCRAAAGAGLAAGMAAGHRGHRLPVAGRTARRAGLPQGGAASSARAIRVEASPQAGFNDRGQISDRAAPRAFEAGRSGRAGRR
ncbi:arsenic resistance protein [Tabrizicola sp. YIM 78059]|uniref:arsenic resistance protein n=1 Tax=Tabrizicola sp. YIM 78059 TaxID=2529861 RepID=UPI0020C09831|nr:bile acid:sodium symporter [Tabrizicola sp. YIM 78059]